MPPLASSATPLGNWLRGLLGRVHKNAAVVALANKLARIVWAVLRRGPAGTAVHRYREHGSGVSASWLAACVEQADRPLMSAGGGIEMA